MVDGDEVLFELVNFVEFFETAKVEAVKPCLTAFWAERALPSGVRGPVERRALARLAASCLGETGLRGIRAFASGVTCVRGHFGAQGAVGEEGDGIICCDPM